MSYYNNKAKHIEHEKSRFTFMEDPDNLCVFTDLDTLEGFVACFKLHLFAYYD